VASLPVIFLTNLACGAVALAFTAYINRVLYFTYVATLWTTPMYLFSNTFFDTSQAPVAVQVYAHIFPLAYAVQVVRPLVIGEPVAWQVAAVSFGVLATLTVAGYWVAYRKFVKRIES
jgi:lipooligosaccharide transport system permease protein